MFSLCRLVTIAALLSILTPAAWAQQVIEPPTARTVMLAKFHFANDNEFHILHAPELDEILAGEYTNAGPNEQFFIDPEMSLAEVFLHLAPEDSPVPRAIAQLDEHNLLAGRTIVDALEETIEVPRDRFGIQQTSKSIAPGTGQGSCQLDEAGAEYFEDHHCYTLGGPGYGDSEEACEKVSSNLIDVDTSSRRRTTYTRMASCGGGMNHFRHFYGTASGWDTQVNVYVDPQKVVSWWSAKTGVKRHRRVIFEDHEAAGWVRGWVKYFSEVAGGW